MAEFFNRIVGQAERTVAIATTAAIATLRRVLRTIGQHFRTF